MGRPPSGLALVASVSWETLGFAASAEVLG
jgi:hypothetical protein